MLPAERLLARHLVGGRGTILATYALRRAEGVAEARLIYSSTGQHTTLSSQDLLA